MAGVGRARPKARRNLYGPGPPWGAFQVVGRANRKGNGLAKATEEAVCADNIALQSKLHAKTLSIPHAYAQFVRVDAT